MNLAEMNKTIKTKMEEVSTLIKTEGKKVIGEAFNELFVKYPELESVKWTQYTPYFNDGDPCTFRVYDFYSTFNLELLGIDPADAYDPEDGEGNCLKYGKANEEKYKDNKIHEIEDAVSEISNIDNDVLLAVFGDHSEITATRDGFEVESYDHD